MVEKCKTELPPLTVDWLLRRYKTEKSRAKLRPYYEELLAEAERLVEPATLCREFPLAEVTPLVEWLPEQTRSVVLGICTLGSRLDATIAQKSVDDMTAAVILSEIALGQINALIRSMHGAIRRESQTRGLKAGPPFRPGVGRWPLETQKVVFDRLPTATIGVTLDEHYLMLPLKSTSVIIPLLQRA